MNTATPVRSPRFALFDLAEGKSYSFRVRCCNSAGVGEPSLPTDAITVGDKLGKLLHTPLLLLLVLPFFLISTLFVFLSDLPSAPGSPVPIRNTGTSVVVSWGASKDVRQLVGYYIECSVVGTDVWMPCNNKPVKQTRYCMYQSISA